MSVVMISETVSIILVTFLHFENREQVKEAGGAEEQDIWVEWGEGKMNGC